MRGQSRIEVQQSARVAIDSMARVIRAAGYDPSNIIGSQIPASTIQLADDDTLTFLTDVNERVLAGVALNGNGNGHSPSLVHKIAGRMKSWFDEL